MRSKSERNFERIAQLTEEYLHLSSVTIATRLSNFSRSNDISIAYKEILKERGINDHLSFLLDKGGDNRSSDSV